MIKHEVATKPVDWAPTRIISGGQTGVDRAALDAAIELGIPHGGSVPRGRRAEDGPLPPKYQVIELASDDYDDRTRKNVQDADATLIISWGALTASSALTRRWAQRCAKPSLHVDLREWPESDIVDRIRCWLSEARPGILNVAGPRESTSPGIYDRARHVLQGVFRVDARKLPSKV